MLWSQKTVDNIQKIYPKCLNSVFKSSQHPFQFFLNICPAWKKTTYSKNIRIVCIEYMMPNHVWWFGLHNIQKVILRGMYLLLFKLWLKKDPLSNFGARTKRTWDCHPGSHNRDTEVPTTTRSLGLQSMSSRCAFPASKLSRTSYWLMLGNQQGWPTGGSTTKPVASFRSSQRSTERSKGWCWGINKAGRLADQPQNPWHRSLESKINRTE